VMVFSTTCDSALITSIPLMSKKMMSMLFNLLFACLAFYRSKWVWTFCVRLMFSSPNACLIIAKFSVAIFLRFAQNLMHTQCSFVEFIAKSYQARYMTPNKRIQKSVLYPSAWNFVHWLPRYASTIIYHCIALLQLLYRW
jgi:hypothetical protein